MGNSNNMEYSMIDYKKMDEKRDLCRKVAYSLFLIGILITALSMLSSVSFKAVFYFDI